MDSAHHAAVENSVGIGTHYTSNEEESEGSNSNRGKETTSIEGEEGSSVVDETKPLLISRRVVSPWRSFFAASESPEVCLYKIILLGESSVGKTSLARRFAEGKFSANEPGIIGVDFSVRFMGSREVYVQLWDTAGGDSMKAVIRNSLNSTNALVFVYDITSVNSFHKIYELLKLARRFGHPQTHLFIVGTKCDLEAERIIQFSAADEFSNTFEVPLFQVSALTGEGVEDAILSIVESLENNRSRRSVRESVDSVEIKPRINNRKNFWCC